MKVLNEKYLLKKAVGALIPEAIRKRHKQPYRAPDSRSFVKNGKGQSLIEYAEEALSQNAVAEAGVFDPHGVGKLAEKAKQGQIVSVKDNMALVGILSTQLVIDRFIKNFPRSV